MTHFDHARQLTSSESPAESSLAWPEVVAITLLIGFIALIASGVFDVMLPWIGIKS